MIETYRKKITILLLLLCGLSWVLWAVIDGAETYFSHFFAVFEVLFIALLFVSNSDDNTFKKWFKFTGGYFLLYFLSAISLFQNSSFSRYEIYLDWACCLYLIFSVILFVYGLISHRKERSVQQEDILNVKRRIKWLLLVGCSLIFLSGFIDPSFWLYGVIVVGIPLFLYCGSLYLRHYKSLGDSKYLSGGFLVLLLLVIVFMFLAISQMNFLM